MYINYTFILYLLTIYTVGNIARKNENPCVLSQYTKCVPLSPNLIFTYKLSQWVFSTPIMEFAFKKQHALKEISTKY